MVPRPGTNRNALHGARGAMAGKQTVPRAELTAILTCLLDIKHHPTIRTVTIYSDCKMAVDGYNRGRAYSQLTSCGALWADIWDCIEEIRTGGVQVHIRKVKAHCEEEAIVPLAQQKGNQWADHYAGISVEEVPASEVARINWQDRKLRAIQERMITVLQMLPKRARHPREDQSLSERPRHKIKSNARAAPAEAMNHVVKRRGPMLECEKCGLFWAASNTQAILDRGPCLGHNTYGAQPADRPWIIPSNGPQVVWGRTTLHRSHQAKWLRGVLYCGQCGCHSSEGQSLRNLGRRCSMNPQSKYAVDTRRMMCTGKPRQGIKEWPMDCNIPGKELLGRYDMYPDPRGLESKSDPTCDPPPTQAPLTPNVVEVQGVVMWRLNRKTNCAGADMNLDARTQRNKDKIRDLQLRRAITGSVKRPR